MDLKRRLISSGLALGFLVALAFLALTVASLAGAISIDPAWFGIPVAIAIFIGIDKLLKFGKGL